MAGCATGQVTTTVLGVTRDRRDRADLPALRADLAAALRADLAAALRALREGAGLSQRELARCAAVPTELVASVESGGARDPRFGTVDRLVRAAGGRLAVLAADGAVVTGDEQAGARAGAGQRFGWWEREWGDARARDRLRRDRQRWAAAGERPIAPGTSVHRLRRGDEHLLDAAPGQAARYLGDPGVYHWVVAYEHRGIRGHLAAYRQRRPTGADRLLVHELQLHGAGSPCPTGGPSGGRPTATDALAGVLLVGALVEEARRAEISDIWALVDSARTADFLGRLGFTPRQRQPSWWELPG